MVRVVVIAYALVAVVGLSLPPQRVLAQGGANRVAPVLARVLAYDRTLTARSGPTVDVAIAFTGTAASATQARALAGAFEQLGDQTVQGLPLRIHLVDVAAGVGTLPAGTDVIVACDGMAGATNAALFTHSRSRRLLLVTLSRAGLEHSAVAIFMEDGRPRIVTKMRHVQDSGIQLASPLLRLAEVI